MTDETDTGPLVHRPRWAGGLVAPVLGLVLRPEVVADEFGVDLRRRGHRIVWGRVRHVRRPGPQDDVVVLVVDDGVPCRTSFPAGHAHRVARLGGVPFRY